MAYNPQNPNGQATMANSAPVVIASDQSDLPIDVKSIEGFYDAGNSSTTPLAGGATFTGAAIEITNYSAINVAVYSDVASATNGFQMQFSPDGTNWDHSHSFTLSTVPGGLSYAQAAELRYFRVVYINGVSAQATFRLTTVLKTTNVSPSRYTVAQAVTATQMADVVKAVIYGETSGGGGGYVDVKVNPSGALTVEADITNGAGGAAVNIQDGGNSITVDGTVTADAGTGNFTVVQSTATNLKTQAEAYQGGTAVSSSNPLNVALTASTTGGVSAATGALGNTATAVSASAGQVYGWFIYNPNTTVAYVQFYNVAAGSVVVGTTTPIYSIGIPGLAAANVFGPGVVHSTAIAVAATTTRAGATGPGTNLDYNIFYK